MTCQQLCKLSGSPSARYSAETRSIWNLLTTFSVAVLQKLLKVGGKELARSWQVVGNRLLHFLFGC